MKARNKILLSIIATLAGLIIITYLALFHLGLLEYIINKELKAKIAGNLPLIVHIDDISGDYFSNLLIKDVFIIYSDSVETYTMAHIPRIDMTYSIGKFWKRQVVFDKISIDSAVLTLKQSEEHKWIIPKPIKKSEKKFTLFDFKINEVSINNMVLTLDMVDDTLYFRDINLNTQLEVRENTYSAIIRQFNCLSSDSRYNMVLDSGRVTIVGKDILFQNLKIKTDSSQVELKGHLAYENGLAAAVTISADNINLKELASFIKAKLRGNLKAAGDMKFQNGKLDANLTVSGIFYDRQFDSLNANFSYADKMLVFDTIHGLVFGGCEINGRGNIDFTPKPKVYNFVGSLGHFNLDNLIFNTYHTDLSGMMNLSGRSFESKTMVLDIDADLNESWFDEFHVHKALGYMSITKDSIVFHDKFAAKYHDNTFLVGGKLEYHGPLHLEGEARLNDLSAFTGQTFLEYPGGHGHAEFIVDGALADPNISGRFKSDSLWLYEIYSTDATIEFDIKRFLFNREGEVRLSLRSGTAYDIPYDTIFSTLHMDTQFVVLDSIYFDNEYTTGIVRGTLDYYSYPQRLTLQEIMVNLMDLPFHNEEAITVDIDSTGYEFIECTLRRPLGFLSFAGRTNYDESLDLHINADRIDITPWVKLFSKDYEISGLMSGKLNLSGNFISPVFNFHGAIDSLVYQKLFLGNLMADFNYKDELVFIDSVSITSQEGHYFAEGKLPINLAFTEVDDRLLKKEQNIRIKASDKRFDLVSLMLDAVEDLTGDFNADLKLSGTLLKPKINGNAYIRNGNLKLYELIQPLEDLYVDLTMIDEKIFLDSVSAICKNGRHNVGIINSKGSIAIKDIDTLDYNVDLSLRQFPAKYELGDISGVVDAELNVLGITPPTVYGDIDIISALYRDNFEEGNEGWVMMSELEKEKSWDLNINLNAKSNLWIKNDDIDAEMAGELNFVRESGDYRFIGSMEILRGKGYWTDRVFRIEPGALIKYEDIEYPNPSLDIYASTGIRSRTINKATNEPEFGNVDLRVRVTGTLDEPIISAAEDSPYSTEDILTMIFTNFDASAGGFEERFGDRITAGISGFVGSQMTRIGSRTLGVETFEIDPVYGDKFDPLGTRVTLGFYLTPDLYTFGRSSISGKEAQEFGFEYRLRRFLLMEGKKNDDNLYRLFLNFYWDY